MKDAQAKVREFMLKAGQECPAQPTVPPHTTSVLRANLIDEELVELMEALGVRRIEDIIVDWDKAPTSPVDLVAAADAIGDLLVVVLGTAVALGIDIAPIFDEIHRSNMTKFIDGYRREDGKWVKGPSYSPANLAPIIAAQSACESNLDSGGKP